MNRFDHILINSPHGNFENISIADIMANRCLLHLWSDPLGFEESLFLMSSLGFRYIGIEFVWIKTRDRSLEILENGLKQIPLFEENGMETQLLNQITVGSIEFVLLGQKGIKLPRDGDAPMVVYAPDGPEKPCVVKRYIELMYPNSPRRIEIFSSVSSNGWVSW